MNKFVLGLSSVCLAFLLSDSAHAACNGPNLTWGDIGGNPVVKSTVVSDGGPCRHTVSTNSGMWESGTIIKKPKNGELEQVNTYTFVYTPKKGFKGKDSYSFKVCGAERSGSKGCVTMEREAVIE